MCYQFHLKMMEIEFVYQVIFLLLCVRSERFWSIFLPLQHSGALVHSKTLHFVNCNQYESQVINQVSMKHAIIHTAQ